MSRDPIQRHLSRTAVLILTILCLFFTFPSLAQDDIVYVENLWNFVDGSMDISGGIPETVTGRLGKIRDSGVLTVATEPYFPPQEFIDDTRQGQDRFVGADMELARLIAEKMHVRLEIVPMDFHEVLDRVADGTYDLAISALAFTESRAMTLTMSKGYYFSTQETASGLLIRAADSGEIQSLSHLASRDIAAQSGSLQETMAVDSVRQYRQFWRMSTSTDVMDAVRTGKVDAGIVDADSAAQYIASCPDVQLTFVPIRSFTLRDEYKGDRVAARKGELELMYFVNGVIDEVLASDQYNQWIRQYSPD